MAGTVACRQTRQRTADLEVEILFGDQLTNEVVSPPRPEHSVRGGEWRRTDLLATGSEMLLAVQARATLEDQGIGCAVVSLPCWELFGRQDAVYRAATLGSGTRIAVEAACRMGWDAYLGTCGGFIGMSGFGASGPADALYEKFGITVLRSWRRQSVCSHIRAASWRAAIDCWRQGAPYGSSHTVSRA